MDAKLSTPTRVQHRRRPLKTLRRQLALETSPPKFPDLSPVGELLPKPRVPRATLALKSFSPVNRMLALDLQESEFTQANLPSEDVTEVPTQKTRVTEQTDPQLSGKRKASRPETEKRRRIVPSLVNQREANVKDALNRCAADDSLSGDFKQTCLLPCITGKHCDLKYVSPDTARKLIQRRFDDSLSRYTIIDCRYPYEFEGGHIRGAKNLYTRGDVANEFLSDTRLPRNNQGRHILIFHCEFSSERGPKLARFLRQRDREMNEENYPYLHYPEIYVMKGGYKDFFQQCVEDCVPQLYKPMLHADHSQDLKFYRAKTKSCESRKKRGRVSRGLSFRG